MKRKYKRIESGLTNYTDLEFQRSTMKRWIAYIAIFTLTMGTTFGCSMCCGPYDYDYPNFGGKHQRSNPSYGRVGSIFSDPNANSFGPSADSNLSHPKPPRASDVDEDTDIESDVDLDVDAELEEMRNELELERSREELQLDGNREEIEPMLDDPSEGSEALPEPEDDGPTASRIWRTRPRPLRPEQSNWR